MPEYVNKEMFLSSMGLVGDETKYGNRDSEHQGRSYGTWMGYEIMDSIDGCVEEDVVKVVRCKECKHYDNTEGIQWCYLNSKFAKHGMDWHSFPEDGFCSYGERSSDETNR